MLARAGELTGVTGVDAPYEPPTAPAVALDTANDPVDVNVAKVLTTQRDRRLLP